MKHKLVIVIDVLENITGGAERQVYELLKAIDRERFSVWLYVIHQKEVPAEINDKCQMTNAKLMPNDKFQIINIRALGLKRIYDFRGIMEGFKFTKFLKQEKIDAVMTYHFGADIWGTYFAKRAGVPVIISNRRDEGFWRNKTHIKAYKWVNKWVDKTIAVSKAVKTMAIDEGVPEDKIELLYSGVDLTRFDVKVDTQAKRKEIGVPVDARLIACVGNLNPIKGHNYLIDAMADVVKQVPNAHLILIGDGQLRKSYELRVAGYELEKNVHFLGKRNDVPELLLSSDLCVLPSLSEGLSNALLEYMAAGKPVIATRVGGNPDVVTDGVNGILVEAKEAGAIAKQIIHLMQDARYKMQDKKDTEMQDAGSLRTEDRGQKTDIGYRDTLGRNARKTVEERFDLRKQIRALQDFIGHEITKARNPRVLHLISSGGLFGAERVMLSLGQAMNMNGTAVWIGAVNDTHNPHLEVIDEARKNKIPYGVFNSKGQADFSSVNRIARFVRERKISLIHTHNYKATVLAALASLKTGVPVMTTNHLWTRAGKKLRFYEWIESVLLKCFVKRVAAVSDAIKQDMVKAGVSEKKISVVYNGIDVEMQDAGYQKTDDRGQMTDIRKEFGIPESAIVIATIARLSPEKGHSFLFQAARRLLDEHNDYMFLIVGDGYLRKDLEEETRKSGIQDNVIFTGYRTDMHSIYRATDMIVQPSFREGIPITLLEAMIYEKPIIATNVGGVASLIKNEKTGMLIDAGDWQQIYNAIKKIVENESFRNTLARNALQLVRSDFSQEKMVQQYKRIYQEVSYK